MAQIDTLLNVAVTGKASDLHLASGEIPRIRRFGRLRPLKAKPLASDVIQGLLTQILTEEQQKILAEQLQLDFSYDVNGLGRFRGNAVRQRTGINATFRVIPPLIPSMDELGLPEVVKTFCEYHQGLILVTGAAGQGKSTTLAAMIDTINSARPEHILTLEDPIEFVHPVKQGLVNQRQLGIHTRSFANALRAALREDPDVIMVGELRDLEAIQLAITAAETGHLVLATLATSSGPKTVDRLVDSFPTDEQNQIRMMLADSLRAVVSQMIIPNTDDTGQVLATEIMVGTLPLANLIRTGKTHQIQSIVQTGRAKGMHTMDDDILRLYKDRKISEEAKDANMVRSRTPVDVSIPAGGE